MFFSHDHFYFQGFPVSAETLIQHVFVQLSCQSLPDRYNVNLSREGKFHFPSVQFEGTIRACIQSFFVKTKTNSKPVPETFAMYLPSALKYNTAHGIASWSFKHYFVSLFVIHPFINNRVSTMAESIDLR